MTYLNALAWTLFSMAAGQGCLLLSCKITTGDWFTFPWRKK